MKRDINEIINDMRNIAMPYVANRLKELNYEGCGDADKFEFETEFRTLLKFAEKGVELSSKDVYMKLKEVYVNLKNYDFDTLGNYKMDVNEAKKFMEAFEKLEVKE